ncbi:energy transducer TonB [Vitreimonas flagellata]|uniref:energy transducer TonB n=1 Tax=Vitreimonas flagellata TaxID=2560861 RepID=UPI001074A5C8|nr:energy transducer TonB [Vitreimonas flagellata]
MADVLIVCVREDEPQAKALADMFEAAGFTIGGAPSNDGALRSSGAGVIVWSQASIRSRPFLDAAQRVINADKAVVASLIEPPPPSSIGSSPAFDLSRWSGDPNDPSLDPLFFAVDRMVNAARASVGAGAAAPQTQAFDEPPRLAPRPAPPPPPQRLAPQPSADPLGGEAEHWRAIRDSRDPSVFMDYLARYGATGTFSEVAELRLKQLTSAKAAPAPQPPPRPAPRPSARLDPPPRRVDPTPPPPRREPPPPPAPRYAEAPRRTAPPPERHYDRDDLRDPPRNQGGALRAFILVALLGGAALAGGLYFGGGLNNDAPRAAVEDNTSTSDVGAPPDAESSYDTADNGTSFSEAQDNRAAPARPTAAAPDREQTRERERQREREREAAASEPVPTPTTNFASNSGGPVSLSASNSNPPGSTAPNNAVTLSPPVTAPATTPASTTPPPAVTPTRPPGTVVFTQRPSANRIAELYPSAASRRGVGGRVQLSCQVQSNLTLACTIVSETPPGLGFGQAALSTVSSYRVRPTLSDGASAVGASTRIAVNFQAPQ